jgi:hypothetical protein
MGDCLPGPPPPGAAGERVQVAERPNLGRCFTRLNDEGYRQRITYHPASHFWRLQWTETALFLVVSSLLGGFCFWWTRRRLN